MMSAGLHQEFLQAQVTADFQVVSPEVFPEAEGSPEVHPQAGSRLPAKFYTMKKQQSMNKEKEMLAELHAVPPFLN